MFIKFSNSSFSTVCVYFFKIIPYQSWSQIFLLNFTKRRVPQIKRYVLIVQEVSFFIQSRRNSFLFYNGLINHLHHPSMRITFTNSSIYFFSSTYLYVTIVPLQVGLGTLSMSYILSLSFSLTLALSSFHRFSMPAYTTIMKQVVNWSRNLNSSLCVNFRYYGLSISLFK